MSDRTSNASYFLLGALVGATTALLLTPGGRRAVRRALTVGIYEIDWLRHHRGSEDESGAVEGGLAAARSWNRGATARS
jgi:hypothetical protein